MYHVITTEKKVPKMHPVKATVDVCSAAAVNQRLAPAQSRPSQHFLFESKSHQSLNRPCPTKPVLLRSGNFIAV